MIETLQLSSGEATATLSRFGAHLHQWCPVPTQPPVLYLSPDAVLDGSRAIRGGVPICFPWFGAHPSDDSAPSHGRARTATWDIGQRQPDRVSLTLAVDPFVIRYGVVLDSSLRLQVDVRNDGPAAAPFEFALHTYFTVGDINAVSILGLERRGFLDQLTGAEDPPEDCPLRFDREVDRVYRSSASAAPGPETLQLEDAALARSIRIQSTGAPSTVVWNPWVEKAARLSDLPDAGYRDFCCIESGCIGPEAVTLEPGGTHAAEVVYEVSPLDP